MRKIVVIAATIGGVVAGDFLFHELIGVSRWLVVAVAAVTGLLAAYLQSIQNERRAERNARRKWPEPPEDDDLL